MEENTNAQKSGGNSPMVVIGIIVALVVVIGAVAFAAMRPMDESSTAEHEDESTMHDDGSMMHEDGDDHMMDEDAMMMEGVIEVEGGAFYFEPNEIRVKAGEEVTITLNSVDMMHDFVIDELDVRTEIIPGGETGSVTFTPTEAGEFEFYCSVGEHRANGMFGTLIVE